MMPRTSLLRPSRVAPIVLCAGLALLFARAVAAIRAVPEPAPTAASAGRPLTRATAEAASRSPSHGEPPAPHSAALESPTAASVLRESLVGADLEALRRQAASSRGAARLEDASALQSLRGPGTPPRAPAWPHRHQAQGGARARRCADGRAPRLDRAALHASFRPLTVRGWTVLADPRVRPEQAAPALRGLRHGYDAVVEALGPSVSSVPFPRAVLYFDVAQLVDSSCVDPMAHGLYDGELHAVADAELAATVAHELTHHVLDSLGAPGPAWLHEGLAMHAARERWWAASGLGLKPWLLARPVPFEQLTRGLPSAEGSLGLGAAYFQSYAMVRFLLEAAPGRGWVPRRPLAEVVTRQTEGALRPEEAFAWAAGLEGRALDEAFARFVQDWLGRELPDG